MLLPHCTVVFFVLPKNTLFSPTILKNSVFASASTFVKSIVKVTLLAVVVELIGTVKSNSIGSRITSGSFGTDETTTSPSV